uniref:Uncharacterized protein n=1 Tax=Octopus bimaculoides TaxID=37653 RepID=A0A0L8GSA2_OCTBM
MHRGFKEDLKLTAYKKKFQQLISAASKKKRFKWGKIMLAEMKRWYDAHATQ